MDLHKKKCVPCEKGSMPPMEREEAERYAAEVSGWELAGDAKSISKDFAFKDFVQAVDFVRAVADIAEEEGHHPDIFISYNRVTLKNWTHSVGGLTENDFIVAAKIDGVALY